MHFIEALDYYKIWYNWSKWIMKLGWNWMSWNNNQSNKLRSTSTRWKSIFIEKNSWNKKSFVSMLGPKIHMLCIGESIVVSAFCLMNWGQNPKPKVENSLGHHLAIIPCNLLFKGLYHLSKYVKHLKHIWITHK